MAIGPSARRMASGSIVVIGAGNTAVGITAFVAGLGLVTQPTSSAEDLIGTAAILLSVPAAVGGLLLLLRRGPARAAGVLGAAATAVLGLMLVIASLVSMGHCSRADAGGQCPVIVGAVAILGGLTIAFGAVSMRVVRRAHPAAVGRRRRIMP